MVRISSGQLKGRRIDSKRIFFKKTGDDELRPTSAKVREAVFDILQNSIKDAIFLDLYAGTGAIGFEALSRGAKQIYFAENNQMRSESIKKNISTIDGTDRACVYRETAQDFLKRASKSGICFDIVFADPPYASNETGKLIFLMSEYDILREGGCLIIEHSSKSALPEELSSLRVVRNYRYGDTELTLYRKES